MWLRKIETVAVKGDRRVVYARLEAVQSLASPAKSGKQKALDAIRAALKDEHVAVRLAAAEELAKIAIDNDSSDPGELAGKIFALQALATAGEDASAVALDAMCCCLSDWHARVRDLAVKLLQDIVAKGEMAASQALEAFLPLALDGDKRAVSIISAACSSSLVGRQALGSLVRVALVDTVTAQGLASKVMAMKSLRPRISRVPAHDDLAMLRALSTAALEHAHTRELADEPRHSHTNGSWSDALDEEDDTDDDEATLSRPGCLMRLGLCIGYMIPTWGHLSLANVGRSWAAGAFALWHCYVILSAALLIFFNAAAALLRCYIQWFSGISIHLDSWRYCCGFDFHTITFFFWTLVKCYLLLSVSSDILRFAYLLCKDAWRPDTFEAYRRLLVSDAWRELDEGKFYTYSWSTCLTGCQKTWDALTSAHGGAWWVFALTLTDVGVSRVRACQISLGIGLFHILVFYFLWVFGEVTLKIFYFRRAWAAARSFENSSRAPRTAAPYTGTVWGTLSRSPRETSAESRSICVLLCTIFHWLEFLMPIVLGLLIMTAGFVTHKGNVALCGGIFFALSAFIMACARAPCENGLSNGTGLASKFRWPQLTAVARWFPNAEALQQWGEHWCRLGFEAQKRQRYQFLLMLAFSAVVFGAFSFRGLAMACLFMVLLVFFRTLWMRCEGSMGWLWAFIETSVELILLILLISVTSQKATKLWREKGLQDAAVVFVLCIMRQFGYQREIWAGERVRLACSIVLGIVHLFFVVLVCFAVESFWGDEDWSAFGSDIDKTKFYSIPTFPPFQFPNSTLPLCLLRMASLTYENRTRFEWGCKHYFPNWRVEHQPESARALDWIRFLMLTSADNSTTVIAVRGTLDFLDVLQDVALWLVPALMQSCNFLGPDVSSGAWGQAISGLSRLVPLSSDHPDRSFSSVLKAAEFMMRTYPERLFYLTGHSLGGCSRKVLGTAELMRSVGWLTQVEHRKLSASLHVPTTVAFAAPGIHHAARVLLGQLHQELHNKLEDESLTTLTVKPMHDLISRIDLDTGNSVVAPCMGKAYHFTNATRSSDLEVDVESSEDEAEKISCCHRLALCIGAWIPTWGHFTFSTVGRSPAAGALALFHCAWADAGDGGMVGDCCEEFMGVFLRSCIVLSVSADLLRFAYLLMIDAWRPDAFEAYRRLVVLDAWGELDAGEFYVRSWSMSLSKWQKTGDIVFQVVLHVTLNLVPITGLIIGSLGVVDPITVRKLCLAIGSLHILAFYFLSFHGEVTLKLRGFRKAWALARNLSNSEVSAQITWTRTKSRVISDAAEQRAWDHPPKVWGEMGSICVLCCTIFQWLQSLMPIFSGIAAAILGFIFHRPGLIVVGCVWSALLLFITILTWHSWGRDTENAFAPESVHRCFPQPEILQEWAEKWCNLGFQAQVLHRYHSTVMLGISAAIFGAFGSWA
eukprot:s361_g6.t1